jgi:serine/threonine protein kinase
MVWKYFHMTLYILKEICRFVYESAVAIKTLHDAQIIHRDIKAANFFLTKNGGFKRGLFYILFFGLFHCGFAGDYGVSCVVDPLVLKTMTPSGTLFFCSFL